MEIREFDVRAVDTEAREVTGIAVPFNETIDISGYRERFERGAIRDVSDVLLFWNHKEPIGRVVRGEETDTGYEVTAVISKTARGDEAYTLVRDGVISKFSVGFLPVEHRMEEDTVVRTNVELKEISLVPFPAYSNASITNVRESPAVSQVRDADKNTNKENQIMTNIENAPEAVSELRDAFVSLEQKVDRALEGTHNTPSLPVYRSIGEYVKDVAAGRVDEAQYRAYTGMTSGVSVQHETFIANQIKLVDRGRKVMNLFNKEALPESGNSVDYYVLDTNTLQVAVQAAEGDDLPYGAVNFVAQTAPVRTYGGYSSLSRQAVERAQLPALNTMWRGLTLAYGSATEGAVRAALNGATGVSTATLAADTVAGWVDVIVDAAEAIESDTGLGAQFVLVSTDVFKRIAHLVDGSGRPLINLNGDGANTVGTADVPGLRGTILGIPLVVDADLAANTVYVAHRDAITTFESPGAPFRLQDSNVVNLTGDFSLYGYLAVAVTEPKALVRVDADLIA